MVVSSGVVERHIITVTVVLVTIPGTSQGTPIKILAVVPKAKKTPAARGRGTRGSWCLSCDESGLAHARRPRVVHAHKTIPVVRSANQTSRLNQGTPLLGRRERARRSPTAAMATARTRSRNGSVMRRLSSTVHDVPVPVSHPLLSATRMLQRQWP